ncbi:FAD-dependent oxidoreductase [Leptospira ilyithenensis]|uniref:FAD-dependent oxidoreductase n=1 Tax=Leptospira ilyithenensis TaxID=2484901 RepID=A0A4R9LN89_9LEPT|nr:FAD-dependent oxidoreductase [Leptospira ilyithenensis]TGN10218.1 FAD-dependent oxidoreductase [Leptospira ilyithenensis]
MNLSRKELFLKSLKYGGSGIGLSVLGGLGYSFFANGKYKMDFPEVPGNKVSLSPNGKTVLILGAGLAGLQAGCELADRGFKVTLLEKSAFPGGKLKSWKDKHFAKKIFQNQPYTREHGLHGIWGFYKNLREFIGRHGFPINKMQDHDSFYYFVSSQGTQSKIQTPTWPVPFDRLQMLSSGIYIPSLEDVRKPAPNQIYALKAASKLWGFNYLNPDERNYLDSLSFYDWAKKVGVNEQYIKHYFEGLAEMGFFMSTKECSALAIANFLKLGCLPSDSRVDYYKWPPDETFINPMVDYIRSKGGEVHFGTEVTSVFVENNRVTKVETNTQYPKGKVKRCRVCGNIMGAGHVDHCPFCGAHASMLEILTPVNSPIKSYTADHIITAMDLPGVKKFITTNSLDKHAYFGKVKKLSTATILCVNLMYENSDAWEKRFPEKSFWNAHDFFPTGYKVLGFTSNWSSRQIPELKEKRVDLIEVQVAKWQQFNGVSHADIAKKVHEELKLVVPDLPDYSEFYINRWDTYTGCRPGDEKNRPEIQSPVNNLYFIGDWVFVPHHCVFMEKTNVTAKMVTNLILEKEKITEGQIEILKSGTPDWPVDVLSLFTTVKA